MPTVRTLVRDVQAEMRGDDLQPHRAAELLTRLSSLYGNILDEMRVAEAEFHVVLLAALNGDEAATRARIRAQVTPEYARMREAADTSKLTLEMMRSLKHYLRQKQEEMRLA